MRERQSGLLPVVPFYAVGLDAGSLIAAAVADVCVTFNGGHSLAGREYRRIGREDGGAKGASVSFREREEYHASFYDACFPCARCTSGIGNEGDRKGRIVTPVTLTPKLKNRYQRWWRFFCFK